MGRIFFIFFGILILEINCISNRYYYFVEGKKLTNTLPEEFKETGLISSSTYQIYFKVKADSFEEALNIAKKEIPEIAYYYISQEPFMFRIISPTGKQKILELIKNKGRFVYLKKNQKEDVYDVVFHIFEKDFKEHIKDIR